MTESDGFMRGPGLPELIARLEAATEGSHELDYDIYRAVNDFARNWLTDYPPGRLPQPTRDLGVALTLVPSGFGWTLEKFWNRPWGITFTIQLFSPHDEPAIKVHAMTPALGVCIAALKAREA